MTKARAANRIEPVYEHWERLSDEEFGKCMTDFEEFCKHSIILDKNGSPVTFNLNNASLSNGSSSGIILFFTTLASITMTAKS